MKTRSKKAVEDFVFEFFAELDQLKRAVNKVDVDSGFLSARSQDILSYSALYQLQQQIRIHYDSKAIVNFIRDINTDEPSDVEISWSSQYYNKEKCEPVVRIGVQDLLFR